MLFLKLSESHLAVLAIFATCHYAIVQSHHEVLSILSSVFALCKLCAQEIYSTLVLTIEEQGFGALRDLASGEVIGTISAAKVLAT